jgi:hypothetical protein
MYTNIDTDHALLRIATFLRHHPDCPNASALIEALEIIMRYNIFQFGNTYWQQLTGTAMGTPPACDYATIYFGIHELDILPRFIFILCSLPLYFRYIDNGIGLWKHDKNDETDQREWT